MKRMDCSNAQNAMMLYLEKRIAPLQSLALHRHVNSCGDCREQFLALDTAAEDFETHMETLAAPEGFTEAVMKKISGLPAEELSVTEKPSELSEPPFMYWLRLAGCVYALLLAAGLGVLYNTNLIQIPETAVISGEWGYWAYAFFMGLDQIAYSVTLFAVDMIGGLGNYVLAVVLVLGLALAFKIKWDQGGKRVGKEI